MLGFVVRRILVMIPTLFVLSVIIFIIIQLPPGDYFETMIAELESQGETVQQDKIDHLRKTYGFDQPIAVQYARWIGGLLTGDLGYSFEFRAPVSQVIDNRLWMSLILNILTIVFVWTTSFLIGTYVATHARQWGDYLFSFIGFLGLSIPNFLLALIVMYYSHRWFGINIGGLMDSEYVYQSLSWGKAQSISIHLAIAVFIIGISGTASMIRRLRANLLDELHKPYVLTAHAKGLHPIKVLWKYPLRVAINPFIADIGSLLPQLISGAAIVSIVLSLPTGGDMLVTALQSQDMYLAAAFLMFLSTLTVVGTLVSDIVLVACDPRIRYQGRGA